MRFSRRFSAPLSLAAVTVLAAITFFTGINWGLPSRGADAHLFGNRTPWTGDEIMRLAGPWQPAGDRGSDRPQHAAGPATRATILNATDVDRAEIVRRYRLYSRQPDEMITFRSLSRMRPGQLDLDPRLYQYGGLWIYPVGGLLKLAASAKLLVLRTDLAYYLDHPDAFGRFYLVARLYSAGWGLLGVVVVFGMTRELSRTEPGGSAAGPSIAPGRTTEDPAAKPLGSVIVPTIAAGVYAAMPVVINAAHEAKPHLAGTVLTLATVWAAARYVRTGRGWAWAAVLAGAAAGMVLTGVAAWVVLPVMVALRPQARQFRVGLLAVGLAGLTFVLANPYLPYDLAFHRERLASNVGNYGNFYQPSLSGSAVRNAVGLIVAGTSIVPVALAVAGGAVLAVRSTFRPGCDGVEHAGWLLAAPALWVVAQFLVLAAGKPAEYARFALTLDVAIAVLAAVVLGRLPMRPRERAFAGLLLVACAGLYGMRYDLNFLADNRVRSTRSATADRLAAEATPGRTLAVTADPAPYGLPPVDLFAWQIVLLPPTGPRPTLPDDALVVRPVARATAGLPSPISWANKPFEVVPASAAR